jgi:hypothetical protein
VEVVGVMSTMAAAAIASTWGGAFLAAAAATSGPGAGVSCDQSQLGELAPDGSALVCVVSGDNAVWVPTAPISPGVHDAGAPCNPKVDEVGRTSSGMAAICDGHSWTLRDPRADG